MNAIMFFNIFTLIPIVIFILFAIFIVRYIRRYEKRAEERLELERQNMTNQKQQIKSLEQLSEKIGSIEKLLNEVD